jgi:hypothetical protein
LLVQLLFSIVASRGIFSKKSVCILIFAVHPTQENQVAMNMNIMPISIATEIRLNECRAISFWHGLSV